MLPLPSPLFTLASIRLLQLWSLMLNTLGWAEAVLTSPPEIREELSAKPHLLYQQGVSASGLVSSVVDTSATVVTTLTQCACPNLLVLISGRLWISQKIDPKAQR